MKTGLNAIPMHPAVVLALLSLRSNVKFEMYYNCCCTVAVRPYIILVLLWSSEVTGVAAPLAIWHHEQWGGRSLIDPFQIVSALQDSLKFCKGQQYVHKSHGFDTSTPLSPPCLVFRGFLSDSTKLLGFFHPAGPSAFASWRLLPGLSLFSALDQPETVLEEILLISTLRSVQWNLGCFHPIWDAFHTCWCKISFRIISQCITCSWFSKNAPCPDHSSKYSTSLWCLHLECGLLETLCGGLPAGKLSQVKAPIIRSHGRLVFHHEVQQNVPT